MEGAPGGAGDPGHPGHGTSKASLLAVFHHKAFDV